MKKICVSFLLILLVCSLTQAFGASISCDDEKEYISQEQIVFAEDGIYIIMNEETVPAAYIGHDANGLYYVVKCYWTCPRCQTVNEWWRTRCKNCRY